MGQAQLVWLVRCTGARGGAQGFALQWLRPGGVMEARWCGSSKHGGGSCVGNGLCKRQAPVCGWVIWQGGSFGGSLGGCAPLQHSCARAQYLPPPKTCKWIPRRVNTHDRNDMVFPHHKKVTTLTIDFPKGEYTRRKGCYFPQISYIH